MSKKATQTQASSSTKFEVRVGNAYKKFIDVKKKDPETKMVAKLQSGGLYQGEGKEPFGAIFPYIPQSDEYKGMELEVYEIEETVTQSTSFGKVVSTVSETLTPVGGFNFVQQLYLECGSDEEPIATRLKFNFVKCFSPDGTPITPVEMIKQHMRGHATLVLRFDIADGLKMTSVETNSGWEYTDVEVLVYAKVIPGVSELQKPAECYTNEFKAQKAKRSRVSMTSGGQVTLASIEAIKETARGANHNKNRSSAILKAMSRDTAAGVMDPDGPDYKRLYQELIYDLGYSKERLDAHRLNHLKSYAEATVTEVAKPQDETDELHASTPVEETEPQSLEPTQDELESFFM